MLGMACWVVTGGRGQTGLVLSLFNQVRDATIDELRHALDARCDWFGNGALRRFACATASRVKKTVHAAERHRPDVQTQRWEWFENQPDLDPDCLS